MLGAIIGDIVGSIYEFQNTKSMDFDLISPWSNFTDDSVMTLAVAKWLVEDEAVKWLRNADSDELQRGIEKIRSVPKDVPLP